MDVKSAKSILLVLAALSNAFAHSASADDFLDAADDNGDISGEAPDIYYLPHEDNCQEFYAIVNTDVVIRSCAEDELFSAKSMKCEAAENVMCGRGHNRRHHRDKKKKEKQKGDTSSGVDKDNDKEASAFCEDKRDGHYPHDNYCHMYYSCSNKSSRVRTCSKGQLFDSHSRNCNSRHKVHCYDREDPELLSNAFAYSASADDLLDDADNNGDISGEASDIYYLPHEDNCQEFYAIVNTDVVIRSCSEDELFSAKSMKCEAAEKVMCGRGHNRRHHRNKKKKDKQKGDTTSGEDTDKDTSAFCADKRDGHYPHDKYCHMYYKCSKKSSRLHTCSKDQLFDSHTRKCNSRHKVHCHDREDPEPLSNAFAHSASADDFLDVADDNGDISGEAPDIYYLPHEDDCQEFYAIVNTDVVIRSCSEDELFSAKSMKCEAAENVMCGRGHDRRHHRDKKKKDKQKGDTTSGEDTDKDTSAFCEDKRDGHYPHDKYCHMYYKCSKKSSRLHTCSKDQLFDSHTRKCNSRHKVHCHDREDPEPLSNAFAYSASADDFLDVADDNGDISGEAPDIYYLPHEDDCQEFYAIVNTDVVILSCSEDELFSAKSMKCEAAENVMCGRGHDRRHHRDKKKKEKQRGDSSSGEDKGRDKDASAFCEDKRDGHYPHDKYCHMYYKCSKKSSRLHTCSKDQLFDSHSRKCNSRHKVHCHDREDPELPMRTMVPLPERCDFWYAVFADRLYCDLYYVCQAGRLFMGQCKSPLLFDLYTKSCVHGDEVICGERLQPHDHIDDVNDIIVDPRPPVRCIMGHYKVAHGGYCNWYYRCHDWIPMIKQCRKGYMYDQWMHTCLPERLVQCNGREKPKGGRFRCPSKNGYFPHEKDCGRYYKCKNYKPEEKKCSKERLYDIHKRECLDEERVDCEDRIHPSDDPNEEQDKIVDPKPAYRCKQRHGRFEHPKYCDWYFHCKDKKSSIRECRRGRLFDGKTCREHHKVKCHKRIRPEDRTTPAPHTKSTKPPTPEWTERTTRDQTLVSDVTTKFTERTTQEQETSGTSFESTTPTSETSGTSFESTSPSAETSWTPFESTTSTSGTSFESTSPSAETSWTPFESTTSTGETSGTPFGSTSPSRETSGTPFGSSPSGETSGTPFGSTSPSGETSGTPFGSTSPSGETSGTPFGSTSPSGETSGTPFGSSPSGETSGTPFGSTSPSGETSGTAFGSTSPSGETSGTPFGSPSPSGETSGTPFGSTSPSGETSGTPFGSSPSGETSGTPFGSTSPSGETSGTAFGSTSPSGETSGTPFGSTSPSGETSGTPFGSSPSGETSGTPFGSTSPSGETSGTAFGSTSPSGETSGTPFGSPSPSGETSGTPFGSTSPSGETSGTPFGSSPSGETSGTPFGSEPTTVQKPSTTPSASTLEETSASPVVETTTASEEIKESSTPVTTGQPTTTTAKPFVCGENGHYPHPKRCDVYYVCVNKMAIIAKCPTGTLFNANTKKCEDKDNVDCGDRLVGEKTTTPKTDTTHGPPSTTTPPTTTTLETTTLRPTGPPPTNCTENDLDCILDQTGDVSKWFDCKEDDGKYTHPSHKSLFIHCINGKPYAKRCASDLEFSEEFGVCIFPFPS